MERSRFEPPDLVLCDLSGLERPEPLLAAVREAERLWATLPQGVLFLSLVDATGARFDADAIDALKALAQQNAPRVRAGAIVVSTPLHRALTALVNRASGRAFNVFRTRAEARRWLFEQREFTPENP